MKIYADARRDHRRAALPAVLIVAFLCPAIGFAQLSSCARITEAAARLACYDELARKEAERSPEVAASPSRVDGAADVAASAIEQRWELRPELQRGIFKLVPHRPVYALVHWTNDPNKSPSSPTRVFGEQADLNRLESKFQLSFKTKLVQDVITTAGDLWFGYTQVSYWQVDNSRHSSPFRETNYEPEIMFVHPLQAKFGGVDLRFAALGINHQSNGRTEPLSRSWNRLIGQVAAEVGPWSFHVQPWTRVFESGNDDNPDIEDFMGRAEFIIGYRTRGHVLTLTGRHSLRSGARSHGSARFDWAIPITGELNAHLQVFTGYGLNLIDYNHRQTTLGIGFSFLD